jgi:carbohydrate-selective porin OprB
VKVLVCFFVLITCWTALGQQSSPPDAASQTQGADPTAPQPQNPPPPAPAPGTGTPNSKQEDSHCENPADPHRRHHGCEDRVFGLDETLAGGWGGVRDVMKKAGITPTLSYIGALQTNATGGADQVWAYAGLLTVSFGFDLKKLLKIHGFSAYADFSWGTGSDLTETLHSSLPVNTIYAPGFYLGEMYLQQEFLDGNLQFFGGRLGPQNTFADLPVFANYVNYGINPGPASIGTNDIAFFSPPPGVEWGLQTTYKINSTLQASAGIFNTSFYSATGNNHGTDFSFQQGNKGALIVAEVDYLHNQSGADKGKPGEYGIGFIHDNNSFPTVIDPELKSDTYSGVYVIGQQMLYRPAGPGTPQGLTVWGAWAYDNHQLICPMPIFGGAGLSYEGLIAARKRDIVSAGWVTGKASDFIPNTTAEQLFELNYQWRHSQYLIVTPHFEYIWKPSGYDLPGAAVFGLQVSLTL